ncbi:MAG: hypothetical protein H7039_10280 [Bryobacteraceae bacterium]|nr:hypothetical protein [Bryobacteraceae bacterium]
MASQTSSPNDELLGRTAPALLAGMSEDAKNVFLSWQRYLLMLTSFSIPLSAMVLAGSGIATQTAWGSSCGMHSATAYTLSLPVSRARLIGVRSVVGLSLLVVVILVHIAVATVVGWQSGALKEGSSLLALLGPTILGGAVYYSVAVFLGSFLSESVAQLGTLALTGAVTGYSMAGGPGWFNISAFMRGQESLLGLGATVTPVVYLAFAVAMMVGAWWILSRKEY